MDFLKRHPSHIIQRQIFALIILTELPDYAANFRGLLSQKHIHAHTKRHSYRFNRVLVLIYQQIKMNEREYILN